VIFWGWLSAAFLFGCIITFWFFSILHQRVIRENLQLTAENERLRQRIQLIGERKLDGTFGQGGSK
jgi:hypothetical protein